MECQSGWMEFQLEAYPVGQEIDPSMATDPEIIGCLRAKQQLYESDNAALGIQTSDSEVNTHLASLHPSELPPGFVASGPQWALGTMHKEWQTPHGLWKQKKEGGYTAVRGVETPCYIGVKRTLEFQLHDGAKTGWFMIQYYKLVEGMVNSAIDEKLIFCKVFQLKEDGQLHYQTPLHLATSSSSQTILGQVEEYPESFFQDVDNMLTNFNPEDHPIYGDLQLSPIRGDQLNATPFGDCINEEVLVPPGRAGRRPMRSRSAVWKHFTKMHKKRDLQDVYAACLRCDEMLKAHSKDSGTSPLWRHYRMHLRAATKH